MPIAVALHNAPTAFVEEQGRSPVFRPERLHLGRPARPKQVIHIADIAAEQPTKRSLRSSRSWAERLRVPLLKEDGVSV